jgi:hypothetical protein
MKGLVFFVGAALSVAACGDDSDANTPTIDVAAACGRIADASCAKLVECKVTSSGVAITAGFCTTNRDELVNDCKAEAAHTTATDADVDACVAGFQQFLCSDLCGKVPEDPPGCAKLFNDSGNSKVYQCAS